MSLLDTASLIVTPNGYKEGKLYSVIPSDGSGDLSVTRATTATRVNSAGLVELVPYNLFSYSQNLANVAWSTYAASGTITRTVNYAAAPDGTTTATRIQNSGGDPIQWTYQNIALASNGIISMYVKRTGATNQTFRFFSNNGATFSSNFTATDTWQRFEFAVGSNSSALPFGITTDSSGTAADILVWGAQLVEGSTAKDYQKTETRLNIPRLDYSNGTCPSLLVEPQRTNLVTYSSSFDNSDWGKIGITATANNTTAPDGTMTADKIAFTNTNSYIYPTAVVFAITNNSFSYSVYAKADTQSTFNMLFGTPLGAWGANFDLTTQTATPFSGSGTSGKIESVGNGWFRCILTAPIPVVVYAEAQIGYPGASGSLFFWGAQLEAGNYSTSYIPTTSASVTRNEELISKTNAASLIGQTEGTIFADFVYNNSTAQGNPILVNFNSSPYTGEIYIQFLQSGGIQVEVYSGGSQQAYLYYGGATNGHHKLAFAYKANDFILYVDGVQVATDTSGSVPACNIFALGYYTSGYTPTINYNAAALWKTRLTNTQLAQLTTI